jgi:hypothetical protein
MTSRKARIRIIPGVDSLEERKAPSGGFVPAYYGPVPPPIVHGGGGGGGGGGLSGGGGGGGGQSTGLPDTFVH